MHRIAVLGLHHDHVWSNLEELEATGKAELVAAADADEELRERYRDRFPGRVHRSAEDLFAAESDLTAAYVFASNRRGEDLVVEACRRGLHCLVEKPMAATLDGAERMLAAAEENDVRLMINWPFA